MVKIKKTVTMTSTEKNATKYYYEFGNKKYKSSSKVDTEIYVMQTTITNAIPKLSFSKLVREIMQEFKPELRIQKLALEALQTATEMYLVQYLQDSYLCTKHARRNTLLTTDMTLCHTLQNND